MSLEVDPSLYARFDFALVIIGFMMIRDSLLVLGMYAGGLQYDKGCF